MKVSLIGLFVFVLFSVSNVSCKSASTISGDVIKFNNTICPVMERKVDGIHHAIYQGIRYELCCGGCVRSFNKNPEKYIANLANVVSIEESEKRESHSEHDDSHHEH
ncbi:MAG: hypothetical protein GY820_31995 [Gammaproteobacteria bacterium]|nr:hypothetical protein [Gammaproteobacteria bacterium]